MDEKEPKSWWEIMDEDMQMDERIEELETENDMKILEVEVSLTKAWKEKALDEKKGGEEKDNI